MTKDDRTASGPVPGAAPLAVDEGAVDLSDLHWTDGVVLVLFWALAGVVFTQFFTRYVLNDSIAWTEEVARFMLIGVTFVGAVMATRKQTHIAVEFFYRWIPRALRRVAQGFIDVVSTAFFVLLAFLSVQIAGRTQQMMVSIDLPKSAVYWIVAGCFACMAILQAWATWRHVATGTSRLIDPDAAAPVRAVD